jgi:hypothetical protein
VDVIIPSIGNVHYNACCLQSKVQKSSFFSWFIATNDEHVLLTIEGEWFKVIVHMKFKQINMK